MTPLTTPDTLKMIHLAFGQSIIMYVTIRNLILCKGYMAVMFKICLKLLILGDFLGSLGVHLTLNILLSGLQNVLS